jgi:predicted transcriptional regulator
MNRTTQGKLTPQQIEKVEAMIGSRGLSAGKIAVKLGLTKSFVDNYIRNRNRIAQESN